MKKMITMLIGIALLISAAACGGGAVAQWQEQYDLGMKYLLDGEYEEAVLAFMAAIEIDPKLPEAYIGRGDAYVQWGEAESDAAEERNGLAVADYLQAIDLDENNAEVYLKAAEVYMNLGDEEAAKDILKKGYEITENERLQEKLDEIENTHFESDIEFLDSEEIGIRITDFYFDKNAYINGDLTNFLVSVVYRCPEKKECVLMIGANTEKSDTFAMSDEEVTVTGSGNYQFNIAVTPVRWDNADFGIYVNLSDAQHESTWSPLGADMRFIDRDGTLK